jgi:S1-C subfamily serine protease
MEDVISAINGMAAGDEITLTILREGEQTDVKVTLGKRPEQVS